MSNRSTPHPKRKQGGWFVSNRCGLHESGASIRVDTGPAAGSPSFKCIVGGPFATKSEALEWMHDNPKVATGADEPWMEL